MQRTKLLGLVMLAATAACGNDDRRPPGDGVGGDGDGGDSVARPVSCPATVPWVTAVAGQIVDEADQGLADARAQLCARLHPSGELQCVWPARADATGAFNIEVPASAQCMTQAVMRVLLPSVDRATVYCGLALPTDLAVITVTTPYVLPVTQPATVLPPLGDEGQQRTVVFADGVELDVVPARYFSSTGYAALAARRLWGSASGVCPPGGTNALEVIAFSPEGDITGAPFALRWTNTQALPANSQVDLFVLGGLSCTLADGSHVPEGVWQAAGVGTVSGDGATVVGEVPCLNWFGYLPR